MRKSQVYQRLTLFFGIPGVFLILYGYVFKREPILGLIGVFALLVAIVFYVLTWKSMF